MVILCIDSPLLFMAGIGIPNPVPLKLPAWNTQGSKVREVVEWGFANIRSNWSFLDFGAAMMVFKSPIVTKYCVTIAACKLVFMGTGQ
jgi:hypothetical protein